MTDLVLNSSTGLFALRDSAHTQYNTAHTALAGVADATDRLMLGMYSEAW